MQIARELVPHARLHVRVDDVGRDAADLDEAVVLDVDGVARQVVVDDRRLRVVQVASKKKKKKKRMKYIQKSCN